MSVIVKKYQRRSNGSLYEVTFQKDKIVKVMNLTGKAKGGAIPAKAFEISLGSDTVKKYMIKRNFKEFEEVI